MPDSLPNLDLAGPSVDDDIRRLIARYGAEQVQAAVKRGTARRVGRPALGDWLELGDVLREDARRWLEGEDPFKTRTNYSIALEFVERHRGQCEESTRRRILGKLAKRRRYYTLVEAEWISHDQYSHAENLRAIRALVAIGRMREQWQSFLTRHESAVADYRTKFGEPPPGMTIREILAEAARPIIPTAKAGPGNVLQVLAGSRRA